MARSKITITGEAKKPPKVNEDGTVDLIFKTEMSAAVPKGLTSLGETNYIVHVAKKTWAKIADKVTENSFYIINGEPKARVTAKGVPFTEVVCFDISLKEAVDTKEQSKEKPAEKPKEVIKEQPKEDNPPKIEQAEKQEQQLNSEKPKKEYKHGDYVPKGWYKPEEVIKINTNDLVLVEKEHLKTKNIALYGTLNRLKDQEELDAVLAVRPIENGKYALVMGIKGYIIAKLLNKPTVKAVIRNCTHEELMAEFAKQLQENNQE